MSEMVTKIANILYEKKAQNIVALNVKDLTVITDCMLIATGRSTIQVRTLADEVEERMTEAGIDPIRKEGMQEGRWVVLDYGEVLVHLFHQEERDFYRLDKLWEMGENRIILPFENTDED
ncbi:MAG: ribosome silencing factor [bacterium]|nr:ribosome silencing factor [bacterium]